MTVGKVEIERLSMTSSKPFEVVVAALKAAVGHPDMVEFLKDTREARSCAELESAVHTGLGRMGLMRACPGVERIRLNDLSLASSIRESYGFESSGVVPEIFGRIQPEKCGTGAWHTT